MTANGQLQQQSERKVGRPPKLWAAFEIGWFRDPRVRKLSGDAKLLFLAGRAYCSEQGTDGYIDRDAVQMIAADAKVSAAGATALVRAELWESRGDGYQDVDFLRTNQRAADRARRWEKERDRKQRDRQPEFPHGIPPAFPPGNSASPSNFRRDFRALEQSRGEESRERP